MTDINKVIIRGRAAADASVKSLPNSTLVTLRIGTDGSYQGKDGRKVERVDWHNVACSQLRTRSYGEARGVAVGRPHAWESQRGAS